MSPKTTTYRRITDVSALRDSLPLRRLRDHLHDLIIISLEAYTQTPGQSFSLIRLHYASDEKHAERYSMHFDALARVPDQNADIPIKLSLSVSLGDVECYPQL